jgi:hypothetical protein
MARRRRPLGRTLLSWLFLLLFCLAAPLALITGWARLTVVDPVVYTATVRGVAAEPRVQDGLVQAVTARSEALLSGENPTATEAVQARVLAQAIGEASREVIASDDFLNVWQTANRNAHQLLFSGLAAGWGQPVALDLSPLRGQLQAQIDALDLDLPADLTLSAADLQIPLLDAGTADSVRRAVTELDRAFWVSLAAAILSFFLSLILAPDRLAALGRIAFGLALAMIALIALILIAQQWLMSSAADDGAGVMVVAIVEAISQGLRLAAVGLAVAGLLLAGIFAGLCALRGSWVVGDG